LYTDTWELWVKSTPPSAPANILGNDPPIMFGSGVCLGIVFRRPPGDQGVGGGTGPCADPSELPGINLGGLGPGSGLDARMLMGVTSANATTLRVTYGPDRSPVDIPAVSNAAFPGLRFFVADMPAGRAIQAVALDAQGTALLQVAPALLPYFP
jgi:hypothetical protein